ncbi:pumilio homolog 12-like isoform X2 [Primulina huaijiensis]|uniref:pumilio homolog 12-like isoform X2 n=1 Tax=Primulina huaijiensis TaxID=1492673 RepID=UPI003CC74497
MENISNSPTFPMQEPPAAENIPLQAESDPSNPGVHGFQMDVNNTTVPVSAGDGPTDRQPPISSLEDLKGNVFSEAMDQYSCQFLHQKLQERKPEDVQMIFSEVKDCICKLMVHRLGSSVIQKLFEVCHEEQMNELVSSVTANVSLLISESMKKFLDCLVTRKQISHMMAVFSYFTPILKVIADGSSEIIVNESGSCLIQDLVSIGSIRESARRILAKIMSDVYSLSKKQFGHRLVEHVIGFERPGLIQDILFGLTGALCILSKDEYASNVVKKLMEASERKFAPQIIDEIISSPDLLSIVVDPCGNSVLQTAKKCSKGTVRKTLNDLICQHSELLNKE